MFERFNDHARRATVLAQREAHGLNQTFIGTEHILLGILGVDKGVACEVLTGFGVTIDDARVKVEVVLGRGKTSPDGHIPFTPRAKKVFDESLREALQLGHNYIGNEHLLLALTRDHESVAARLLSSYGATHESVRRKILKIFIEHEPTASAPTGNRGKVVDRLDTIVGLLEEIAKKDGTTQRFADA